MTNQSLNSTGVSFHFRVKLSMRPKYASDFSVLIDLQLSLLEAIRIVWTFFTYIKPYTLPIKIHVPSNVCPILPLQISRFSWIFLRLQPSNRHKMPIVFVISWILEALVCPFNLCDIWNFGVQFTSRSKDTCHLSILVDLELCLLVAFIEVWTMNPNTKHFLSICN